MRLPRHVFNMSRNDKENFHEGSQRKCCCKLFVLRYMFKINMSTIKMFNTYS